MPKYKCINKKCPNFGLEMSENTHRTYISDGTIIDHKIKCPECGTERVEIEEAKGFCTHAYSKTGNLCRK